MSMSFVSARHRRWLWLAIAAAALAFVHPQRPVRAQADPSEATGQSVTKMPNGRELLVGGIIGGRAQRGGWLRDVSSGQVVPVSPMQNTRAWHTATLLPDGSVLVLGGDDAQGHPIAQAERFDPETHTFERMPELAWRARAAHTATLTDGRHVVLAGGVVDVEPVADVEVLDLDQWQVSPIGMLSTGRAYHSATLLGRRPHPPLGWPRLRPECADIRCHRRPHGSNACGHVPPRAGWAAFVAGGF